MIIKNPKNLTMVTKNQLAGIGILGLETALFSNNRYNDWLVENDKVVHFGAGLGIGLLTKNPVIHVGAILGWEVVEPFLYKIKYPNSPIQGSAIDTMEDIIFGAIGVYVGNKLSGS